MGLYKLKDGRTARRKFQKTQLDKFVVNTSALEAEPRSFAVLAGGAEVKTECSIDYLEGIHRYSTSVDRVNEEDNTRIMKVILNLL